MESRISKNNNGTIDYVNKPIVCYKKKSYGVIVGEFDCITEFLRLETLHRPYLQQKNGGIACSLRQQIYSILNGKGKNKYMKSYHFNCDITIKFKKAI